MTDYQLDFSSYIAERTRDFTGRKWVFAEIDRWLADPDGPNFFIITGEPGIGKTAIAGRLTQIRDIAAHHFCIARQADTIDPVLFARSISQQLCSIDGFVAKIPKDSNIDLKSEMNIQANYGTAIGIKIENLTLNAPSPAIEFTHSVTQPLKELYADGYDQQIIILVDALDEAAQFTGRENIIALLANAGTLPGQVRFVLTSRLDQAVLRHLEHHRFPQYRLDAEWSENLDDIRLFVLEQLKTSESLGRRLEAWHMPVDHFISRVTTACGGNFLFIVWLLDSITAGTQRFQDLETFPQGLGEVYRDFLRTRIGEDLTFWRKYRRPLLGVLAVAYDFLTEEHVKEFTGFSRQEIRDGMQDLQQFLEPMNADKGRYRLYHASLKDWLIDEKQASEFWIDPKLWHENIVNYYLNMLFQTRVT